MALTCFALNISCHIADISPGMLVSGSLLVAFILLAVGFSFYQIRRMRRQMNLLSDEARERRAQDEELASIGSAPTPSRQRANPWE